MAYEVTEEDYKYAELAAHKVAPLFQCFQWIWAEPIYTPGDTGSRRTGSKEYVPTVQQIADEFIRLIEQFETGNRIRLETGRLGIMKNEEGYQLYLTL
jgi:hypothetical protein